MLNLNWINSPLEKGARGIDSESAIMKQYDI